MTGVGCGNFILIQMQMNLAEFCTAAQPPNEHPDKSVHSSILSFWWYGEEELQPKWKSKTILIAFALKRNISFYINGLV